MTTSTTKVGWAGKRVGGWMASWVGSERKAAHSSGSVITPAAHSPCPLTKTTRHLCVSSASRTAGRRLGLLGACIPGAKRGAAVELAPQPAAEKMAEHKEAA